MNSTYKTSLLPFLAVLFFAGTLLGQQFQAITSGSAATDLGVSLGSSWGDYDGDGDVDLFVTNLNHINNVLYENIGDNILQRVTSTAGGDLVNDGGVSGVGVWGDIDNDGNLDIFVSRVGRNALYRNTGNGTFVKLTGTQAGDVATDEGNSTSGSWVDYDGDGDLDLFVTNINGEDNVLYENKCEGYFVRTTAVQVGSLVSDGGSSLGGIWQDYDLDGDPDLFVANGTEDAGEQNFLYENNGNGSFTRILTGPIVTSANKSVGGSWADINNDRLPDLFVANADGENNQLFINLGDGNFSEVTSGDIVSDGANSVGSGWADVDNDGDLDLFVANTDDENNALYYNNDGVFSLDQNDPSANGGGYSSGIAFGDFTGNGFQDLYVTNSIADTGGVLGNGEANFLFSNVGNNNNYLKVQLVGTESNIQGIGARILISTVINGQRIRQFHQVQSLSGSGSQNSVIAHFGLGDAASVDTLRVFFPSGVGRTFLNVTANQTIQAFEPGDRLFVGDRVINFGALMAGESLDTTVNVFAGVSGQITAQFNEIVGENSDQFTFSDSIITLFGSKGASGQLTAGFRPTRNGTFEARLNIETNGGTGCVLLRGIGLAPVLTVNTDTLPFNASEIGVDKIRNLRLTNTGQSVMNISGLQVGGADAASFDASLAPTVLNVNESVTVPVTFSPDRLGDFSAEITINSDGGNKRVALSGSGVSAIAQLPSVVDFGLVFNDSTARKILRISNPSSIELQLQTVYILDENEEGEYRYIQNTVPGSILPGGSANIALELLTNYPGEKRADFIVVSNAPTSPDTVALMATSTVLFPDPDVVSRPDSPIEITYRPPPGFVPDRGTLYYRPAGSRSFDDSLIIQNIGNYQFMIPAGVQDIRGIEFYAKFERTPGVVTVPPLQPENDPDFQASRLNTVDFPLPLQERNHRMISIPLVLNDRRIERAFRDLGGYNSWRWRLFRWDNEEGRYLEYPELGETVSSGASYWLVTHDAAEFSLYNAASVTSDPQTFTVRPGWNQLANPFAYPVDWSDVVKDSTVENPVVYDVETGTFQTTAVVDPWSGFFIYKALESGVGSITIPPLEAQDENIESPLSLKGGGFAFEIHADAAGVKDRQTYVGQLPGAAVERGDEDFAKAPPIGDYLQVAVAQNAERLAGSFAPLASEGATWDLQVTSSLENQSISLTFARMGQIPADRQLFALDLDNEHALAIEGDRLILAYGEAHEARNIRLIFGSETFARENSDGMSLEPAEYQLKQNYPNPFNPVTEIPFQIKTPGAVKLTVYNILGQKVRTLINEHRASGSHSVIWNGRDDGGQMVANGIYLYKLESGGFSEVKKMIFLK